MTAQPKDTDRARRIAVIRGRIARLTDAPGGITSLCRSLDAMHIKRLWVASEIAEKRGQVTALQAGLDELLGG